MRENIKKRFRERSVAREGEEEERAREIRKANKRKKRESSEERERECERVGAMCERN